MQACVVDQAAIVQVAPGLDHGQWSGAMLVGPGNTLWGVRVTYEQGGKFLTGPEIYEVAKAGPYAPDGSYAKMESGPLTVAWARATDSEIVGEVRVSQDGVKVAVEAYPAHDFEMFSQKGDPCAPAFVAYANPCQFRLDSVGALSGTSPKVRTAAGATQITGGHARFTGRSMEVLAPREGLDHFRLDADPVPAGSEVLSPLAEQADPAHPAGRAARLFFRLSRGERLLVRAKVATSPIAPGAATEFASARSMMDEAADRYERTRLWGEGPLGKAAGPAFEELLWMCTWHPFEKRVFLPPGRTWMANGRYNFWGWDENFNAVLAGLVNGDLAASNVQMAAGCERVGPYAMWSVYQRHGDVNLLRACYPIYRRVYPPGDAELVRGRGDQNGNVGKGMDDTPMREHGRKMGEMFSLDMSCMKAWSLEAMSWTASALGQTEDAAQYRQAHATILQAINRTFWNQEHGIYRNRYVSGEWAITESPTSFYPWLACAPSMEQSQRLSKALLDGQKFWGRYVIPTLAKDDPEYGKPSFEKHDARTLPPFCYWRGAVWAPPNYLTYEGLKRYELDDIAAELAAKSVELWWGNWTAHGGSSENYNPQTGERTPISQKHQSWSMLLPLLGIKELIDVEWWDQAGAIRFGSMATEASAVRNCRVYGHVHDVTVGGGLTELRRDGKTIFRAKGGPCVVRGFRAGQKECLFRIKSGKPLRVELDIGGSSPVSFELPAGRHRVAATDGNVAIQPDLPLERLQPL